MISLPLPGILALTQASGTIRPGQPAVGSNCHGAKATNLTSILPLSIASAAASALGRARATRASRKAEISRRQKLLTLGNLAPVVMSNPAEAKTASSVGLGTCCLKGQASEDQVYEGLKIGYRLLDTASHYENEGNIADAIRRSGIPREDVFLITKIWFDDMGERAAPAFQESLKRLQTDYVDLLLIHFPGTNDAVQSPAANAKRRAETWRVLEEAKAAQQAPFEARSIGVANFTRRHLKQLLATCKESPEVMQTEVHPYFQQPELLELCRQKNLKIQAFSPLAHGELGLLNDRLLTGIAAKYQRSVAQVVLQWLLQQDITPIAFSGSPKNMMENFAVKDFSLTSQEMDRISFLDRGPNARVGFDPNLIA
ncbi:unnamed protein product [Durusdinium trenchii]|uniref:NADP-dependent oxidoreductase domain-containing protein n=1 Tax=Durusdinium trenchii TaxID=1381693 RepID=A0ABP0S9K7_9DINO